MAKDPAFPFYAQDFLTGVMHMDYDLRGMYITLLAYQWNNGDKIPKKRLGFILGITWDNLDIDLKEKFKDCDEYIVNERLFEERKKRLIFKEKQSINGKKGGRPKNPNKTQKKPLEDEYEKEGEYKKEKEVEIEIYPNFDDFWDEYDKKVGDKSKIKKKWDELPYNEKEKIMNYVPHYKLSSPDKKFRKNPETFFNNKSWNDEIIISNENRNHNNNRSNSNDFNKVLSGIDDMYGEK